MVRPAAQSQLDNCTFHKPRENGFVRPRATCIHCNHTAVREKARQDRHLARCTGFQNHTMNGGGDGGPAPGHERVLTLPDVHQDRTVDAEQQSLFGDDPPPPPRPDGLSISNVRLRGKRGLWRVDIAGGVIQYIGQENEGLLQHPDIYNADGRLLIPQYCENHIHLDYANTVGVPRQNESGTLFEAIEIWRERKELGLNNFTHIKAQATKAARQCVSHGVGFIRTHVDVTDPDLTALKALLAVKNEVKTWCEIQIVAFPQNGIYAYPDGAGLMRKAMDMGADVVGGIPHLEPTRDDGVKSLQFIFNLAEAHNAMVDVHCDEIDDDQSRFIDVMAAETTKRNMQGRVTVSHAVAMAYYSPGYLARLIPKLKASGVGFAIAPRENLCLQGRDISGPVPRGVAPVRTLIDNGMRVGFSQDSICDPWYPIGDGNPLRNLDAGLHVAHMLTPEYTDHCLDFVTSDPASNMGLGERYGIRVGLPANIIVVDAKTDGEAVRLMPRVMLSVHNGREVFRQPAPEIQWRQ